MTSSIFNFSSFFFIFLHFFSLFYTFALMRFSVSFCLSGTSAEILDDSVRNRIASGRLNTVQWKEVVRSAHSLQMPTTATMM